MPALYLFTVPMKTMLFIFLQAIRMIVLPAEFSDREFITTREELEAKVAKTQTYFNEQLGDKMSLTLELGPVVKLSQSSSYYGANYADRKDILLHEAVMEACRLADPEIDFNGVGNIVLITAGISESDGAAAEMIWPQHARLSDYSESLRLDSWAIDSFCVATELTSDAGENPRPAGISVLCHEIGHALGLYDMYDSDGEGSGGLSSELWGTGLMGNIANMGDSSLPPNFNALDFELLGLGDCDTLKQGKYVLEPIHKSRRYLKVPCENEGEFFLIECRDAEGWDAELEGSGLLIYHIDRSDNEAGHSDYYGTTLSAAQRWEKSQINANPSHQCAYIVSADPQATSQAGIFFPQSGHDSFGSDTQPAFRFWNGQTSELAITDIFKRGDGSVSFTAAVPVAISNTAIFQDAMILQWEIADHFNSPLGFLIEWTDGDESWSAEVDGKARSYTIEGLKPQRGYSYKLTLRLSESNIYSTKGSFVTKYYRHDSYPYIYLGSADRLADGSFQYGSSIPLRVFNAPSAREVKWYFDGNRIYADEDGFYRITRAGQLKAEIWYEDGESEVIIKEIRL